jgi:hypothetical protein
MNKKVFNESIINQFQVIYELIAPYDFRGNKGLLMLATTAGEYEPCVRVMELIKRHLQLIRNEPRYDNTMEDIFIYFMSARRDFEDYDNDQRVETILMCWKYITHRSEYIELAYNDIPLTTLQKNQWLSITQTKIPSNFKELLACNYNK